MRPTLAAVLLALFLAAPAHAGNALEEWVAEGREEEGDEINSPREPDLRDGIAEEIRAQRCLERALERGLSSAQAAEWCSR